MNSWFVTAMLRATDATRTGNLLEATGIIQDALVGVPSRGAPFATGVPPTLEEATSRNFGASAASIPQPVVNNPPNAARRRKAGRPVQYAGIRIPHEGDAEGLKRWPMAQIRGLGRTSATVVPPDARYLTRSFVGYSGARDYKLYLPASVQRPRGLIVMLHGCKQDPDDFAVGTNMNAIAEIHGLAVVYPGQTGTANPSSCWNWFRPSDQARGTGEPSIIAGITREIAAEFSLERDQVFVAGLSAGGAMAAVMGEVYPDLYSAVGVHSGLPCGAASDVVTAFSAMRGDACVGNPTAERGNSGQRVRTIVFQGDADQTVHPVNADRIVAAVSADHLSAWTERTGRSPGGREFVCSLLAAGDGTPVVEYWRIKGAGHAWSGGSPEGSYTDPAGPDASAEMVRFFLSRRPN